MKQWDYNEKLAMFMFQVRVVRGGCRDRFPHGGKWTGDGELGPPAISRWVPLASSRTGCWTGTSS